jgi:hypothetical protein
MTVMRLSKLMKKGEPSEKKPIMMTRLRKAAAFWMAWAEDLHFPCAAAAASAGAVAGGFCTPPVAAADSAALPPMIMRRISSR